MTTPMGERIRDRRKQKQFTLDQLAAKAGCTKGYIWELENKNPPRPSAEKLAAIASALDTTVDVLIGTPINTEDELSQADKIFFRKFVRLPEHRQDDIRKMLDLWDDE
ncbi:helix-turn-helix domain-containing protein [Roseibium sp.]|uniref:helix-turn-helix domain-containing protein n=1 Tax=Roseibium sp. TaxID=1936156 RepID=UPI003BA89232